ncbi:hypothetical protein [Sandarakinorhabdus sp. DWP1-3-1]|uniref:hypothetical protein n=1 Tax=Sandarakinorhabdus sp. DWP1-3-1 TaxID=2804627 RepID=UPI003CF48E3B
MHPIILALLLAAEPPAAAPVPGASVCAALPETGPVARPGPPEIVAPKPTADRKLSCPDDFRLDVTGRMPMCLRAGIRVVDGSPRNACYAALPFGPIAAIAPRHKPTHSCPTSRLTTIVRIDGANAGVADAAVSVVPPDGITVTSLTASGADVDRNENPVLQGCFAFACRLVKLEIGPRAAARVELRLTLPGRDPISQAVRLADDCPH